MQTTTCIECKKGSHFRCRYALDGTSCLCNENAHRNIYTGEPQ